MNLVNGEWGDPEAQHLVEKAARRELVVPPSAKVRVWAEIEKRRAQPRVKPFWRFGGTFAAGALCTAMVVLLVLPRLRGPEGALVIAADGAERTVQPGHALPELSQLSLVDLHGAGRMVAGAHTVATLKKLGPDGVAFRLDRGSLLAHVMPRPDRAPFLVETPAFTAKVVGTVLRVNVHRDGSASIAVGHGTVEVQPRHGKSFLVRSGERWPADTADAPADAELDRLGAPDLEGVSAGAFVPAPAAPPPSTLHDESALYEAGFRAMREQHDPRAALTVWEQERSRFREGVLRREVDASIIDALVALHQSNRARAEIDAYLRRDPDGLRSAELHYVRGTLYREADGGCRRALAEFDRALQRPAEPWAGRARTARNTCKPSRTKARRSR